jgi:hypothetical protein
MSDQELWLRPKHIRRGDLVTKGRQVLRVQRIERERTESLNLPRRTWTAAGYLKGPLPPPSERFEVLTLWHHKHYKVLRADPEPPRPRPDWVDAPDPGGSW